MKIYRKSDMTLILKVETENGIEVIKRDNEEMWDAFETMPSGKKILRVSGSPNELVAEE
ncbi:MAG: hypothetical protein M0Q12_00200 [Synergistaceae bacterium]|jgi:hypothetical protein|nr:hypothetical protein [Synergistaceae bacterium]